MPKQIFRINGQVIDETTRDGIAGLRVEAWDKDLLVTTLLGSTLTGDQGAFHLEFSDSSIGPLGDRHPDLFFKVFHGEKRLKSTEQSVLRNLNYEETNLTIEVKRRSRRRRIGKPNHH